MTFKSLLAKATANETLNFVLTNRIPRVALTRFMGWFSKIEQPLVRDLSLYVWKLFSDLDLSEAKHVQFKSMHECFTRELKVGARQVDSRAGVLTSPCDAIIGASGVITGDTLLQAKGQPYALSELLHDSNFAERFRGGAYVTLRLTSSMYHRFHAPHDCAIERITYIAGDAYNVNPPALKRIARLFCRNERAVLRVRLTTGEHLALVPVAAVLVASIRLRFLDVLLHLRYAGANDIPCRHVAKKGEELGWFEHGSTIIVLAPRGFRSCHAASGERIRMGEALMALPDALDSYDKPYRMSSALSQSTDVSDVDEQSTAST